jgi:pilus assembly protein CpaB
MGRRTLLLIAALVVAALGTTGVFLYVNGVDERAEADFKLVDVLVATTAIETGTSGQAAQDAGALELRPFLAKSVEDLPALSDIQTIASQVALAPIAAGSPILSSQFGALGQSSQLPIAPGEIAVSLNMDDVGRVAGFVGPGSKVVLFMTTAATTGPDAGQESTCVLLPEVDIIAAGQTTVVTTTTGSGDAAQTEQIPRALLTVSASQDEAQKIVYAQGAGGKLAFGLLNDESKINKADACATSRNLFN